MLNISDANRALLNYIDSLLLGDSDLPADSETCRAPRENLTKAEGGAADNIDQDSDPVTLPVLFFDAAGIPLAISMAGIPPIVDVERSSLQQAVSAVGVRVGLLNRCGREIVILDVKDIIFPNGVSSEGRCEDKKFMRVILLGNGGCGLGCDDVGSIVHLQRRDVDWCSRSKTRPWLSGMVKGHNRALLEVDEIIRMCAPNLDVAVRNDRVN